jgi:drug/metabolite transporter (DMT)-like permease
LFFGALSGALFGALAVAVRWGLMRGVPAEVGATVGSLVAHAVVGAIALVSGAFADPIDARNVLVFAAIGVAVPGLSQIAFVQSIRFAGAARAAVLIGVAPLLSFILAAIFLGEGINAGLVAGAALIVAAGASLSLERRKPPGYRRSARCSRFSAQASSRSATPSSAGRPATPRWTRWCARSCRWRRRRSSSAPGRG